MLHDRGNEVLNLNPTYSIPRVSLLSDFDFDSFIFYFYSSSFIKVYAIKVVRLACILVLI